MSAERRMFVEIHSHFAGPVGSFWVSLEDFEDLNDDDHKCWGFSSKNIEDK
jgi:hypothetical protein